MIIIKIFRKTYFWLALLLIIGFLLRLYKIDSPIADWHSWRQADTAAVTRNFIKEGFNPLKPKYDDMSPVAERPVANPARYRFVEFPIYNIAVYPFYLIFGIDEKYHRLVSILFSLGSTVFLYFIIKKYSSKFVAAFAALTFTILPFNVFFSRSTLPEPTFIFFALGMMYFVGEWLEKKGKRFMLLGYIFTSIAFLIKPWAIFFYLPLLYLALKNKKFKVFLILSIFAVFPFIFWRLWIQQMPSGIPASSWLANGDNIRFRPSFWWWIVSERMGREVLGATGLVLFFLGLVLKPKNGNYFLHLWTLSLFLYFIVFATGNVRHNYYQLIFVPVASAFVSLGFAALIKGEKFFVPRIFTIFLALLLYILAIYFGYKTVSEFYKVNNPSMVEAGKKVDEMVPKNAIVLAPYGGDTAFLYQTNRAGWAYVPTSIRDLIADYGVNYYVSTSYDGRTNWVLRHFYPIWQTSDYVIADLTRLKKDFSRLDPEP